jgi:hypothetical protein
MPVAIFLGVKLTTHLSSTVPGLRMPLSILIPSPFVFIQWSLIEYNDILKILAYFPYFRK